MDSHMQRNEKQTQSYTIYKNQLSKINNPSKWIKYLTVRLETTKLIEQITRYQERTGKSGLFGTWHLTHG